MPWGGMTAVRRRILLNVQQGKDLYATFEGSRLGGAIRSVQMWPNFWKYVEYEPLRNTGKLTEAGVKALEKGKR